jgi:hypothetical protein
VLEKSLRIRDRNELLSSRIDHCKRKRTDASTHLDDAIRHEQARRSEGVEFRLIPAVRFEQCLRGEKEQASPKVSSAPLEPTQRLRPVTVGVIVKVPQDHLV